MVSIEKYCRTRLRQARRSISEIRPRARTASVTLLTRKPVCPSFITSRQEPRSIAMTGRPVSWLTTSLRQFGPLDEFPRSTDLLAAAVSDNTFRSKPWWRDTNEFTRRFLIWRRRNDHEAGHCQAVQPQPHPHQGGDPISRGDCSQRGGREARERIHHAFPLPSPHRTVHHWLGTQCRRVPLHRRSAAFSDS